MKTWKVKIHKKRKGKKNENQVEDRMEKQLRVCSIDLPNTKIQVKFD